MENCVILRDLWPTILKFIPLEERQPFREVCHFFNAIIPKLSVPRCANCGGKLNDAYEFEVENDKGEIFYAGCWKCAEALENR